MYRIDCTKYAVSDQYRSFELIDEELNVLQKDIRLVEIKRLR